MHRLSLLATIALLSAATPLSPLACGTKIIEDPAPSDDETGDDDSGDDVEENEAGGSKGRGGSQSGKGGVAKGSGGASTTTEASTSKGGATAKGGATGRGGAVNKGGSSGTGAKACSKQGSWSTSDQYGGTSFDEYIIRNNAWGLSEAGAGQQTIWAISSRCWGVDATHQDLEPKGRVKGYPDIARGWTLGNKAGANGLAIQVSNLTKAKIRWSMQAPTTGRTWALWDIYFHETNTPPDAKAPVNLMIQQRIVDDTNWMQTDSAKWNKVTFDGITFREKLETTSVSSTRNRIQLYIDVASGSVLGMDDMTLDLKAVIDHYVSSGQIKSSDWLTSIQAGFEIVSGGTYVTDEFWTALNDETEPK